MADITILRCGTIMVPNTRLGRLVLDECFDATQACCVDDGQYWFTDPTEFSIVEKVLSDFGIKYTFPKSQ
jgi:hypothetical protein